MAVAAYAAVVSLTHVLDQIQQYPPPQLLFIDRDRIEILREKVTFLQDFLEVHPQRFYAELEGLARQIAAVAAEAEDIIHTHIVDQLICQTSADESDVDPPLIFWKLGEDTIDPHAVDQLHKGSAEKSDVDLSFSWEGIDNVMEKIDSIKKELMMAKEGMTIQELGPKVCDPAHSLAPPSSGNNSMVGFEDRLDQIIDELTGDKYDLQVLPIVGMGGIGKTTLAINAFDNPYIKRHFDIRTWFTISQKYSMHGILLGLLEEPGDRKNKETGESLAELGYRLHKRLFDRKYLIVLDDVWSTGVWDDVRWFFPDNRNGSRVIVTTRLSPVGVSLGSRKPYWMDFLDEDKSWDLFCKKAFVEDGHCPPEFEEVGKNIAKNCKGLPLAIVVTGGLLSKSNMTQEYWECVAKDVNSFANLGNDEHCLKILSLSYNDLPIHLKPCFLHMGVLPNYDGTSISTVTQLWVAHGCLKPMKDKTLEEVAEEFLEDLIARNLILRCPDRYKWEIELFSMHDILRDLCIRESHKDCLYWVPKNQTIDLECYETTCFLCSSKESCTRIDLPRVVVSSPQTSIASCLVCDDCRNKYPQLHGLRLAKVLDTTEDIVHPTKLRCLHISGEVMYVGNLIYLLWNLQILDIVSDDNLVLPSEIWELPQLRHLMIVGAILPHPPLITEVDSRDSTIILKNLQTLEGTQNFRWSEDAIERVPNLKKLDIHYYDNEFQDWSYYSLHNLGHLHKLESLYIHASSVFTLKNIAFPQSLKELTLVECDIAWEEMTIIGSLPNLEVLRLFICAFEDSEWNPVEGEFLQLKKLTIQGINLEHWGAEKIHFPNLERLKLAGVNYLVEIPSGIGEIETLRSLRLDRCGGNAVNSAKEILEEQYNLGNEDLELCVDDKLVFPSSC